MSDVHNVVEKALYEARKLLNNLQENSLSYEPPTRAIHTSIFNPCPVGEQLIKQGSVACVLLAGGQATRLGSTKGMFPITPVFNKTLFQFFFEKVKAASLHYEQKLQIALMLSPLNFDECKSYLENNHWFDLDPDQIHLFKQHLLPLLSKQGDLLSEAPGKLLEGPSGNGEVLHLLNQNGILAHFEKLGITSLQILPIDNPLANPFDPHLAEQNLTHECAIKACIRHDPQESVGILVSFNHNLGVIEYSEASEKIRLSTQVFPFANTGLYSFSLSFAKRMAQLENPKWHLACKQGTYLNDKNALETSEVFKIESFLFDLLPEAKTHQILIFPREEIFHPLKTLEGPYGVKATQEALCTYAKLILRKTYDHIENKPVEIDPSLLYGKNPKF